MRGNDVYLEAPDRTQDLLNIKWTLQCAGFGVRSTWHEDDAHTSALASTDHWDVRSIEQLKVCNLLIVIWGKGDKPSSELAMMAGLALARGLQVIWSGVRSGGCVLSDRFRNSTRLRIIERKFFRRCIPSRLQSREDWRRDHNQRQSQVNLAVLRIASVAG
jgi:hypothetical protein